MKIFITKRDVAYVFSMSRRKLLMIGLVIALHVLVFFLWWGRHTLTQPVTINPVIVTLLPAEPNPASPSSANGKTAPAVPAQPPQKTN